MSQEIVPQQTPSRSEMLVLSSQQTRTQTKRLLLCLPDMNEDELLQCAHFAEELGKSAYLIQGAVADEIRRRYPSLPGRRQASQEMGRKALLKKLAAQHGLSLRMIEDDAAIYTTFVACRGGKGENASAIILLPLARDFYRFALQTPDPHASIRHALQEKQANPAYSTRAFREYVRTLKGKKAEEKGPPFRMQIEGARLSVQTGQENCPQDVLALLKKAVNRLEEQLLEETDGRFPTEA